MARTKPRGAKALDGREFAFHLANRQVKRLFGAMNGHGKSASAAEGAVITRQ